MPGSIRQFPRNLSLRPLAGTVLGALLLTVCGCTTLSEYIDNGFKVGPNYKKPPAPVAPHWIDANDVRIRSEEPDDSHWWTVFNDPQLNELVQAAYHMNLTAREAAFRVLQNRAMLTETAGNLFPQTQNTDGSFTQTNLSREVANRSAIPQPYYPTWGYGFNLAWEIDFWGRFRRAIESARDDLDASVENYDDVLVTLVGDVASTYVTIRTYQMQIAYARSTLALQRESLSIATAKYKGGQASQVDVYQGQSDVSTIEGLIEQLQIPLRQAGDRLCVLLGIPAEDVLRVLGDGPIPVTPPDVIVGVPADLLRRRPDVRKAERLAASQNAQIGVAIAALYPAISITGTMGWSATEFRSLFAGDAFRGAVGPSFTWNILNYGRLLSNIRVQDASFQALVADYQNKVLQAGAEVEDGLVTFLRAQSWTRHDEEAVNAEAAALKQAIDQYKGGLTDYNRVVLIQERLVERQQTLAQAQGQIAQGLIQVYRAVGGGWQIRLDPPATAGPGPLPPANAAPPVQLPPPQAVPPGQLPAAKAVPTAPLPPVASSPPAARLSGPASTAIPDQLPAAHAAPPDQLPAASTAPPDRLPAASTALPDRLPAASAVLPDQLPPVADSSSKARLSGPLDEQR